MANSSGFLAGGLADLGSQVATGLLGGQELLQREEERRARLAQSQFLNRLRATDMALKERQLTQPTVHGQYLLDPNGRVIGMLPLDPLQRAHVDQAMAAQRASQARTNLETEKLKRIDQPKPQADPVIARFQQGIDAAHARGDEAAVAKLETALRSYTQALHGTTPATESKTEHERLTDLWLKANNLPDTPANRLKSPYRPETADERREAARQAKEGALDLQFMRGGPWLDTRESGIKVIDNLTRAEWNKEGGHASFQKIHPLQQQTAQLIAAQGFPAIDQMKNLVPKILARYPGANLGQLVANVVSGKLSDPDVREFEQARTTLAYEISRAMGGSTALRKYVSEMLRATEVPNLGDQVATANKLLENSRTVLMNYIRELKGWKPFSYPGLPRTVEATEMATGKTVRIKLGSYEPLPDGYEYRY